MKLMNREPTEEMLDAVERVGDEKPLSDWGKIVPLTYVETWQAMYDAAPEIKVDMEPVAWDVYVSEQNNSYIIDSLDDPQCVDDLTNHNAVVEPLYSAKQVATLQSENEHHRKTAANSLIGLCKCGEEKDALLKAIQNVKDVKGRHHTELAMLAMFELLKGEK